MKQENPTPQQRAMLDERATLVSSESDIMSVPVNANEPKTVSTPTETSESA